MTPKKLAGALTAIGLRAAASDVHAQVSDGRVKIGYITDLSELYADIDGQGGVEAVKMTIEDAGGKVLSRPVELVMADYRNKVGIATSKAREWVDQQGLGILLGGTNSAMDLAISKVASEKERVFIDIGAGTARLINEEYAPYTTHYAYDTVALARGTGNAVVKQGGKSWSSLTADYMSGHSLENDTTTVMKVNGGTVVGSVKYPLSASDFSSYLLQAQSSKAQIPGLANADGDTISSIKAAKGFDITKTMKIAGLLMFINDMRNLGLQAAEGLLTIDNWYWDMNDASHKFANHYFMKMKKVPNSLQAASYSVVSNYIKAVAAADTDDPGKVTAQLKKTKIDDSYMKDYVRQDGRAIHDMHLLQVRTLTELERPWDYPGIVTAIPGEQAFTTPAKSRRSPMKK